MPFLKHESCPKCGSKDNVGVYKDGHKKCFTPDCKYYVSSNNKEYYMEPAISNTKVSTGNIGPIPDRRIEEDTCRRYGTMLNGTKHFYPYYK